MKFWLKNANSGNTDSFSRPTTAVAADSRKKYKTLENILSSNRNSLVKPKPIQAFGSSKHPGRTLKVPRHAPESWSSKEFSEKHRSKRERRENLRDMLNSTRVFKHWEPINNILESPWNCEERSAWKNKCGQEVLITRFIIIIIEAFIKSFITCIHSFPTKTFTSPIESLICRKSSKTAILSRTYNVSQMTIEHWFHVNYEKKIVKKKKKIEPQKFAFFSRNLLRSWT